jgi:hypothetical protein
MPLHSTKGFQYGLVFVHPRYFLGGDRPSQTTNQAFFLVFLLLKNQLGIVYLTRVVSHCRMSKN